jgi:glycosyltransferase involved in cell wall biosynthesis
MRVILLANEYPPFIFGGIATFMKDLSKGLSRLGVDVTIVSGYPTFAIGKGFTRTNEDGVTVLRLPYPDIPPRHTMFQLANLERLNRIAEIECPDVIHGQSGSAYPALIKMRKHAPVVVTFHTSPMMEKIASVQSILRGGSFGDFYRYVVGYPAFYFSFGKELQESDAAVTVSRTLRSELLAELGQKYAGKTIEILNGVNIEKLDHEYETLNERTEESEETILFAGRLFWRKGALSIIKMAYFLQKENSKFRIIVHGAGPLFKKMQSSVRSLGLSNVELKGFTTRSQLIRSMKLSKFIAIPSVYEACPIILLEGMCLGKIPLMLNLPFASELTEGGKYGILSNNLAGLTTRLTDLSDHGELVRISNMIRGFARSTYDINKVARKYLDLYERLSEREIS